jgi:hypothetical protein
MQSVQLFHSSSFRKTYHFLTVQSFLKAFALAHSTIKRFVHLPGIHP